MAYSVEMLSLSKIGRLLKEKLGDDATQYLFPDDFEKAIADIDFQGVVFDGIAPYEVIIIGKVSQPYLFGANRDNTEIASARWIGVDEDEPYAISANFFFRCVSMTSVTLPVNTVTLGTGVFSNCSSLTTINNLSNVTTLNNSVFSGCTSLTEINLPKANAVFDNLFSGCSNLKRIYLPKITNIGRNGTFTNCTSLEYLQIGSVGAGITNAGVGALTGVTQSTLTIEAYVTESIIDTFLTNLRNKCTNATIIFKASGTLTYNGANYDAGDTILTSTPS